jgi:hypothetical protein
MARTHRNREKAGYRTYRRPHTQSEIRQLRGLMDDNNYSRNRDKVRSRTLPTVYDDIRLSALHEDYRWWHHWDSK